MVLSQKTDGQDKEERELKKKGGKKSGNREKARGLMG